MAKQNVTFIERHVEKIIVGVCGAVFVGACAMYLVQSPHRVQSMDPVQFYTQFRSSADQTRDRSKTVKANIPQEAQDKLKHILFGLRPPTDELGKLSPPLQIAFVQPGPRVPEPHGPSFKQLDLAEIL